MKRYVMLTLFGLASLGTLAYLYQKSESRLVNENERVLNLFMQARAVEAVLERDLLESRNFLLNNYDTFIKNEQSINSVCDEFKSPALGIYKSLSAAIDLSVEEYCDRLMEKIDKVEAFKSKNAILRNSLFYIQKLATDSQVQDSSFSDSEAELLQAALAYALISTPESKISLESRLKTAPANLSRNSLLMQVYAHAKRINEMKGSLDSITQEIVNSNSTGELENLRKLYFIDFHKEEARTTFFKKLLVSCCVVLIGFIIYNLILLGRSALQLNEVNLHLEERVQERTKELSDSRDMILQQKEVLAITAKMSALGEMSSGIAHEVNTPLTVIQLRTDHLIKAFKNEKLDRDKIITSLIAIDATVKRISKIINGLRCFSRDGKRDPKTPYAVSKIVDETFTLCRERFYHHNVELTYVCEQDFEFNCRSHEISQVLLNLLNNSFDAIESMPEKWIRVEIKKDSSQMQVIVEDSGLGIPKDVQEKMLQPFFTTKAVGKGTGLGLSISKGIVEDHGGRITIDNECKNTRIVLIFPLNAEGEFESSHVA